MSEKELMLSSQLYLANDFELKEERLQNQMRLKRFNELLPSETEKRYALICEIFSKVGTNCSVYPPFFCDYGYNIEVGCHFFANINCTILDIVRVVIGDNVMLGPNVTILTASHPISAALRNKGYGIGYPIEIGDNVWIGANAIINPGVHIGCNTIIGSGSVVTHDIPASVIVAGNPCRIIREISEELEDGEI